MWFSGSLKNLRLVITGLRKYNIITDEIKSPRTLQPIPKSMFWWSGITHTKVSLHTSHIYSKYTFADQFLNKGIYRSKLLLHFFLLNKALF